jgi:hypothetical protein
VRESVLAPEAARVRACRRASTVTNVFTELAMNHRRSVEAAALLRGHGSGRAKAAPGELAPHLLDHEGAEVVGVVRTLATHAVEGRARHDLERKPP